jgi:hypothetical protein
MDIQTVFYVLGIIFMVLSIAILLSIFILLLYIRKKVSDIHHLVENKIEELTELTITPVKKATEVVQTLLAKRRKQD